ncbi:MULTISPECIES: hypothetical protein [Candidatus Ichthyocystis]|uniref:hypothetical protein n=1 Tax=Candidatus Ichthyocystis TaxID=2929841 RepID=UPI000B88CC87|nr:MULTISPECIES: hypothetical protein [Ichthyocystis]
MIVCNVHGTVRSLLFLLISSCVMRQLYIDEVYGKWYDFFDGFSCGSVLDREPDEYRDLVSYLPVT